MSYRGVARDIFEWFALNFYGASCFFLLYVKNRCSTHYNSFVTEDC